MLIRLQRRSLVVGLMLQEVAEVKMLAGIIYVAVVVVAVLGLGGGVADYQQQQKQQ